MATYNYKKMQRTATRLIKKFGKPATMLVKTSSGTEWSPEVSESEVPVTAVDLDREIRDANGTSVGESKRTLFIEVTSGVTPDKGDEILLSGETKPLEVDRVKTLNPGGTVLLHEVELLG